MGNVVKAANNKELKNKTKVGRQAGRLRAVVCYCFPPPLLLFCGEPVGLGIAVGTDDHLPVSSRCVRIYGYISLSSNSRFILFVYNLLIGCLFTYLENIRHTQLQAVYVNTHT